MGNIMNINDSIEELLEYLANSLPIVYPTSTLPALGCLPTKEALDNLFKIKKRPSNMPVSLGVIDLNHVEEIVNFDDYSVELLNNFPKGSLTLLLPAKKKMDLRLGGDWIAVRPVINDLAIKLISKSGPLTATSANLSGKDPQLECRFAAEELKLNHNQFVCGSSIGGLPSTLVKVDSEVTVMREGIISREDVITWSTKMN